MEHGDDEAIVAGLRAGDRAAWLRLYDCYAPALWRQVARLLDGGSADARADTAAADVMQATMIAAAESARNYDAARGTLWMWLFGIARRQVALHSRARQRQHQRTDDAADVAAVAEWLAGDEPAPPQALESRETADCVRRALAELADEDAFILAAAYMEQMTMREVAALLGKSAEATRSHAARARRNFRDAFARLAGRNAGRDTHRSTDHVA
jgi:RNA polymerase sigma-70 factor (ECF subfamily)